jgi:hydroxypyruvate isomerase
VSEGLPIAANISTLFRELPLLERFQGARSHGFDGVEIQVPYSESPEALARAAGAAGMPVVLINVPVVASEHPFGIAGRPELRPLFRAQLAQVAEYAEALDVSFVHVLAGLAPAETGRERGLRAYEDNLDLAADILRPKGIVVLIEPLNPIDVPGYLLNSFDVARSILSRRGPGIGMQFDAYHATRMGLDLIDELRRALPYVRHVQFADVPGRHEPGTGSVPFRDLLSALSEARYAGWLGAEYFPVTTTDRSVGWLAEWRAAMSAPSKAP